MTYAICFFFFFQAEDGIRDYKVTGVQTCALPISRPCAAWRRCSARGRGCACGTCRRWTPPPSRRPWSPATRRERRSGRDPPGEHHHLGATLGVTAEAPLEREGGPPERRMREEAADHREVPGLGRRAARAPFLRRAGDGGGALEGGEPAAQQPEEREGHVPHLDDPIAGGLEHRGARRG